MDGNYSPAYAIHAEGERIGLVICRRCGAALLLSTSADAIAMHDQWHVGEVER